MYAFFEFKIKVRLQRSAWHGYQCCVRKRVQMWEKLKNNSPKNNSAICQKTVNQQSKDKQKLADRQPILLQGTVVGCITCIKLDVGIYKPLMHPLVQLTLHVYP